MTDLNSIANSFVSYYYQLFDNDRSSLKPLYKDMSMLTFEGQQFQGAENITRKLTELPFQKVKHEVVTYDAQPSNPNIPNAILVLVTGRLLVKYHFSIQRFWRIFFF